VAQVASARVAKSGSGIDDLDRARSAEYALLATLMLRAPDQALLDKLATLAGADDGSPLGRARAAIGSAARATDAATVAREYANLFIGVGRGEILPYASFYRTGFLHSRPLADLRVDLARLGIAREAGRFEPEDHLGTLLEVMAGLLDGTFEGGDAAARDFFTRHIEPWGSRVLDDVASAPSSRFYRAVADAGRLWLEIETEAFTMD
jgi:TorA maturation chaperone TorD